MKSLLDAAEKVAKEGQPASQDSKTGYKPGTVVIVLAYTPHAQLIEDKWTAERYGCDLAMEQQPQPLHYDFLKRIFQGLCSDKPGGETWTACARVVRSMMAAATQRPQPQTAPTAQAQTQGTAGAATARATPGLQLPPARPNPAAPARTVQTAAGTAAARRAPGLPQVHAAQGTAGATAAPATPGLPLPLPLPNPAAHANTRADTVQNTGGVAAGNATGLQLQPPLPYPTAQTQAHTDTARVHVHPLIPTTQTQPQAQTGTVDGTAGAAAARAAPGLQLPFPFPNLAAHIQTHADTAQDTAGTALHGAAGMQFPLPLPGPAAHAHRQAGQGYPGTGQASPTAVAAAAVAAAATQVPLLTAQAHGGWAQTYIEGQVRGQDKHVEGLSQRHIPCEAW